MRAMFLSTAAVAVCATAAGCLAAAAAVGGGAVGAAYVLGDVERTYPYPLDVVWGAAQTAMAELELPPGFDSKDALKARIDRRTATGDRIRLTLTARGQFTKLVLRVNTFGDRSMSQVIVNRIESHLPAAPYDALPPDVTWPVPPEGNGPDLPPSLPPSNPAGSFDD
jgi:Protein of unknown function (DUF3568)